MKELSGNYHKLPSTSYSELFQTTSAERDTSFLSILQSSVAEAPATEQQNTDPEPSFMPDHIHPHFKGSHPRIIPDKMENAAYTIGTSQFTQREWKDYLQTFDRSDKHRIQELQARILKLLNEEESV